MLVDHLRHVHVHVEVLPEVGCYHLVHQSSIPLRHGRWRHPQLHGYLLAFESLPQHLVDQQTVDAAHRHLVAHLLHHLVELPSQVACQVERLQVVLEGDAAVFPFVPFQGVEHHIAESVHHPGAQRHLRRAVFQRFPVVLHQIDGILVCQG